LQVVTREEDIVKVESEDTHMGEAAPAGGVRIKVEEEKEEGVGQQGRGEAGGEAMDVGDGGRPKSKSGQQALDAKGGASEVKTEPSVRGEPGEPPPPILISRRGGRWGWGECGVIKRLCWGERREQVQPKRVELCRCVRAVL
jgi:hypothetical protein